MDALRCVGRSDDKHKIPIEHFFTEAQVRDMDSELKLSKIAGLFTSLLPGYRQAEAG